MTNFFLNEGNDSGSEATAVEAEVFDGEPGFAGISQEEIDQLFSDSQENWIDYWDSNKSLPDNYQSLMRRFLLLPGGKTAYDIATAYALFPAQVGRIIPLLFCHGQRGSGKSTFGLLMNALRGIDFVISPSDTFASIRNQLADIHPAVERLNPTACIVWDNVSPETLLVGGDKRLYNMLLSGYNRATSIVSIASQDGTNHHFQVFCPKVVSSVHAIHSQSGLEELSRRLLLLPHKPISSFSSSELKALEHAGYDSTQDLLTVDGICWDGIRQLLATYWSDRSNVMRFVRYRNMLSHPKKNKLTIPTILSKEARYHTCIDLLATGVATALWDSCEQAIDVLAQHYETIDKQLGHESPLAAKLREFLSRETSAIEQYNQAAIANGRDLLDVTVNATKLKQAVRAWHESGEIAERGDVSSVKPVLEAMGWHLTKDGWHKVS